MARGRAKDESPGDDDDGLPFRTARSSRVLSNFGNVFRDQSEYSDARTFSRYGSLDQEAFGPDLDDYALDRAADAFYARSELSARGDAFVSHAWSDSPTLKYLALCFYANIYHAVAAGWICWAAVLFVLLAAKGFDLTAYGRNTWIKYVFTLLPAAAFFIAFFFAHGLAELWRPRGWWLDKLCIHQRRHGLKVAGIRALPRYARLCEHLVMLQSTTYFSRLWCAFECATFMAAHPVERVVVIPLWLAPWVLAVVLFDSISSVIVQLLIDVTADELTARLGITAGPLIAYTLVMCLAYAPVAVPIVVAYRAREDAQRCALEQLSRFSLAETGCSVAEDRAYVEQHVRDVFGGGDPIGAFEAAVRTDVARLCVERCGSAARMPFVLALLPVCPFMWSLAADVLACEGRMCAEAAAINGFADTGTFMVANAFACLSVSVLGLSVIPLIMAALRRTERLRRPRARAAAGAAAVVGVYGLWGGAAGAGTGIIYTAMSSGFCPNRDYVAVAGAIAWNAALVAWTVLLFR